METRETLWPRDEHTNKFELTIEVLDLENSDPSEVGSTTGPIFLDFSKIQLKYVHAL